MLRAEATPVAPRAPTGSRGHLFYLRTGEYMSSWHATRRVAVRWALVAGLVIGLGLVAIVQLGAGTARATGCPPGTHELTATKAPTLKGTGSVGSVLTASSGSWSGGCSTAYTYWYQWYHAGEPAGVIYGANSPTYTLTSADAGIGVYAVVIARDGSGGAGSAPTNTIQVGGQAPVLGDPNTSTIDYAGYDDEVPVALNVANGNGIITTDDFDLPNSDDVTFTRTLNTLSNTATDLGFGWRQNWGYDDALALQPDGSYLFNDPSGYTEKFTPTGSGTYTPSDSQYGTLTVTNGAGTVATDGGDSFLFDSTGALTGYDDYNGGDFSTSFTSEGSSNPERLLTGITDPGNTTTTLSYNPAPVGAGMFFLSQVTDPSGNTYGYQYDSTGLLQTVTNSATGVSTTITYQPGTDQPTQISLSDGHVTKIGYDSQSRINSIEQIDPSSSSDVTTTVAYGAPTDSSCTSSDVGETTVTGGQDDENQVYCYDANGNVTNYTGGD